MKKGKELKELIIMGCKDYSTVCFELVKESVFKGSKFDKETNILTSPILIPEQRIYRNECVEEYYIYFTEGSVRRISNNFMLEDINGHIPYGDVLSTWLDEDGTWFLSCKIYEPELIEKLNNGELNSLIIGMELDMISL